MVVVLGYDAGSRRQIQSLRGPFLALPSQGDVGGVDLVAFIRGSLFGGRSEGLVVGRFRSLIVPADYLPSHFDANQPVLLFLVPGSFHSISLHTSSLAPLCGGSNRSEGGSTASALPDGIGCDSWPAENAPSRFTNYGRVSARGFGPAPAERVTGQWRSLRKQRTVGWPPAVFFLR